MDIGGGGYMAPRVAATVDKPIAADSSLNVLHCDAAAGVWTSVEYARKRGRV